jgi:tetratricopeptide (TPR) repeat protein
MKRIVIFISVLFFVIVLYGCGNDEEVVRPNADTYVAQGWIEYAAGSYESAITRFQIALTKDSENAEAYNGIGWSYARLGKVNDSIDNFKKATSKNPENADAHAGLAGVYFISGNYEQAIASAKKVLNIKSDYQSPHDKMKANNVRLLLAESYYNMGDYASAKSQLEQLGANVKTLDSGSSTYLSDLLLIIDELSKKI